MANIAKLRLRLTMAFARAMRVAVDVHSTFFAFGKNDRSTPTCCTSPK